MYGEVGGGGGIDVMLIAVVVTKLAARLPHASRAVTVRVTGSPYAGQCRVRRHFEHVRRTGNHLDPAKHFIFQMYRGDSHEVFAEGGPRTIHRPELDPEKLIRDGPPGAALG